ncbi:hypothetical protein M422DRAFT_68612 [Sphaerobolus stellatus SS14]|uniref:Unplaced genomic scaffold SPHSTscaffold_70, whole genome shotgun sequence n=1 Tax=Sphaerobolus stellatus (strain SS14) TaxID=990650 RepID=A0A0C9UZT9_SPHS4|nr:hypothetical protein M422DRAFT_68612 [Sphaerobolus stellatus SS14]
MAHYHLIIGANLNNETREAMVISGLGDVHAAGDSMKIVVIRAFPNVIQVWPGTVTFVIDWVNSMAEIQEITRLAKVAAAKKKSQDESIHRSKANEASHTHVKTWDWDLNDWVPNEIKPSIW